MKVDQNIRRNESHEANQTGLRSVGPALHVAPEAFHPKKIMEFKHELVDHPLLKISSLIELAKDMEPLGLIRYHGGHAKPDTNFESAPETHATGLTVQETLLNIDKANSWVAFHYIDRHPEYKKLVDACLDQVQPLAEYHERRTYSRAGWIFVSSPGATTPYHLDHEHNFLMQIQGEKKVHVWDATDRSVVSDQALENFHARSSRSLINYTSEIQKKAHSFNVVPGMGVYMPSTSPHMVQNGSNVSITLSVTYLTDFTRRAAAVHSANHVLRRRGLNPASYGKSPLRDSLKFYLFSPYFKKIKALR